jgi:hypothetical protein
MRINELLVESQQLDEGPFTQAVGKVGGKIARGVANIGKDLKTGFKAGYSGEEPPADAPTTTPAAAAPTQAAPVKKPGLLQKIGQAAGEFKQGYQQGQTDTDPAASQAAPAATKNTAIPAADPAAEKAAKIGVGQINKIIPTLRTRDLMSLQANLEKTIASKKKTASAPAVGATTTAPVDQTVTPAVTPPETTAKKGRKTKAVAPTQAEIDADRNRLMGNFNDSIERHKQRMVAEGLSNGTISIFKR